MKVNTCINDLFTKYNLFTVSITVYFSVYILLPDKQLKNVRLNNP